MITKQTQAKINDLICALSDRATTDIVSGSAVPLSTIDSLRRLIEVTAGGISEDKPPVCGFVISNPSEEAGADNE
ncbi:hypothetical protein NST58_06605 [Paenibacillus sp. FSL R10-2796]|uniref:hypothetical protein n=1 Tax=unclassified Paenibacillus TaxID=185978 RepID=UPI0030DD8B98